MGGEGSGRLPNPETIAKKMVGVHEPKYFMPGAGIGAVKPEALRSSPIDITGGGAGGHTIQEEGVDLTARTYLNFSGNGVTAYDDGTATVVSIVTSGSETDPIFLSLSGNFAAALGADDNYVTDAEKVVIGNTSGTNTGDQTSIVGITGTIAQFNTALTDGNFVTAEADPIWLAQSGNYAKLASPTFTGTVTIPTPFTLGAVSVTPTGTELNYVDGVTSSIQTQLNTKIQNLNSFSGNTISGNAIRTLEDHSTSGNSAVVGIITHTSATPPTASNFPIGTLYIQYTA